MMDALGRYVFCVAGASMIVGILLSFGKNTGFHAIMKLICGIFLLLCILRPVAEGDLTIQNPFAMPFRQAASDAVSQGEEYAQAQLHSIIKKETQAYILDKATELGAQIRVDVKLSQDPLPYPVSVEIRGSVSPYCRQKLQQLLSRELSIAKENQIWTG